MSETLETTLFIMQVLAALFVFVVGIGVLAFLMMSQFETILEMALISYTMIGASLAPPLLAAFFWKRVTRIAGVASIASGMLTVISIAVINSVLGDRSATILGIPFPMDTDYIAIPAVIVSVSTLVIVSLLTPKPADSDWREFMDEGVEAAVPPKP